MLNFDTMTLEDIETIETLTGTSIDSIVAEGQPKGKVLKVLLWVVKRKTDPNFSIEQAAKIPFQEAVAMLSGEVDNTKD